VAFKDLRDLIDGRFLDLPIDGRTYRVHDVDAETGMWVQKVMDLGIAAHQGKDVDGSTLDDEQEVEAYERILRGTYDEMVEAGVEWGDIKHVATTAMIWIAFDEDTAQKYWETGDQGEEVAPAQTPGPNRASRRASSAAVRKTRSRASTTTTRASRSTTKKASPGARSSASGA
jgi:hypothetical protein